MKVEVRKLPCINSRLVRMFLERGYNLSNFMDDQVTITPQTASGYFLDLLLPFSISSLIFVLQILKYDEGQRI